MSSINLANAVKAFIPPLDMTSVPGLKDVQVPEISISIVNKPFQNTIALPGLPTLSKMDLSKKGVGFLSKFQTTSLPTGYSMGGAMSVDDFCFGQADASQASLKLRAIISTILPDIDLDQLSIPDSFPNPLDIQLNQFCFSRANRQMNLSVSVPGTIDLIPGHSGLLSLTNTDASVSIDSNSNPKKIAFSATSTSSLGGMQLNVSTARDSDGEFFFEATPASRSATLTQIASNLGTAGTEVAAFMSSVGLSDFTLSDVLLQVKTSPTTLTFKASASYKTLASVSVEFVVYQPFTSNNTIALAMETSSISLTKVVSTFVDGVDISDVPFIGSASLPAASVLLVNRKLPTGVVLPFSTPSLSELSSSLKAGSRISALFPLNFPRAGLKNLHANIRPNRIDFRVSGTLSLLAIGFHYLQDTKVSGQKRENFTTRKCTCLSLNQQRNKNVPKKPNTLIK